MKNRNWHNLDDKSDRHIDTVTIKSFRFNSIISVIMTKLETTGKTNKK